MASPNFGKMSGRSTGTSSPTPARRVVKTDCHNEVIGAPALARL
jgi:hypothetical protein